MVTTDINVSVPAAANNIRVLRVIAADAAAAADLEFDRYSDLELAISEASSLMLERRPTQLSCTVRHAQGRVDVRLMSEGWVERTDDLDELSMMVLEATTDEFTTSHGEGGQIIEFSIRNIAR